MAKQVITFGCRLNSFESEVIKEALHQAEAESANETDIIVFNTCAVTKEAQRQAKQAIRKAHRENPNAKIIVTGCAAQINPEKYAAIQGVSKVLGNQEKLAAKSYQNLNFDNESQGKILVNDIMSLTETSSHMISGFEDRVRAFIEVQNGCNHRCTFCIIPFGRGNSRSVPVGEIVQNISNLVANGYEEVVLTGVDLTDYGKDLPGAPSFGSMIKRLLKLVPGLKRLRLSSLDVAEIDQDLMELLLHEPRIMPHVHISLQAGDDMILKRMKRRHTRDDVLNFVAKLRKLRPEIAFGADIIAGFPTETDEMFENSLKLVEEAGLQFLHVFPYSSHEATPASKMPQVKGEIIKRRAAILREAGKKQLEKFLQHKIAKIEQVVVEKLGEKLGEKEVAIARCDDFTEVSVMGVAGLNKGDVIKVKFSEIVGGRLVGVV